MQTVLNGIPPPGFCLVLWVSGKAIRSISLTRSKKGRKRRGRLITARCRKKGQYRGTWRPKEGGRAKYFWRMEEASTDRYVWGQDWMTKKEGEVLGRNKITSILRFRSRGCPALSKGKNWGRTFQLISFGRGRWALHTK